MNQEQQIIYLDKNYKILLMEQEFIVHPAAFGLVPLSKANAQCSFSCTYHIEDFRLYLDKITVYDSDNNQKQYDFGQTPVPYNGAILIGENQIKDYSLKGNSRPACFSYQNVLELVFEDGVLITTVDQNKAMGRIRKNLELGLRSLSVNRDLRCIRRFMNSAFVGDYKAFKLPVIRMKYLREMKEDYDKKNIVINS